ncbi:MAG: hypothetical protein HKO66_09170 [Saprospiraceae bacterium]|nr:RDD family protein [Bacteroidia bacterium]NNE16189.1 hypothetical protein [Saprospiraceae bacterium]NNL92388.1 hypothetical protein [Saprospiraceae bacterium]
MKETTTTTESLAVFTPNLITRIKTTFIDYIIMAVLFILAFKFVESFDTHQSLIQLILVIVIISYEPILTSFDQTIGQKIMGLKVYRFNSVKNEISEQNLSLVNAYFRFVFKILLGFISLFTIRSNPFGKAIHDKLSGSVMTFK